MAIAAAHSGSQWHSYLLPILAALAVHVVLAFLMAGGLSASTERKLVQPHKVIRASLVELKPMPKPAVQRPAPVQQKVEKPKPVVPPKSAPGKVKQEEKKKPAVDRAAEARRQQQQQEQELKKIQAQREQERLANLLAQEEAELEAAAEFEQVAAYVAAMRAEIASYWSRPPSARNNMEVLLSIRLLPNGDVVNVAVKKGSGNAALDRSALHAVEKVGRFDMLRDMPGSLFDRHFRNIDIVFRPEDLRL
ncbi:MAG: TonB family protein [Pseudomonadales bacterium]